MNKTIYVTAATAARATGITVTAIYRHIMAGNLVAGKMPGFDQWLIAKDDLQNFLAARAKGEFTHKWKAAREAKEGRTKQRQVMEAFIGDKKLTIKAQKD